MSFYTNTVEAIARRDTFRKLEERHYCLWALLNGLGDDSELRGDVIVYRIDGQLAHCRERLYPTGFSVVKRWPSGTYDAHDLVRAVALLEHFFIGDEEETAPAAVVAAPAWRTTGF